MKIRIVALMAMITMMFGSRPIYALSEGKVGTENDMHIIEDEKCDKVITEPAGIHYEGPIWESATEMKTISDKADPGRDTAMDVGTNELSQEERKAESKWLLGKDDFSNESTITDDTDKWMEQFSNMDTVGSGHETEDDIFDYEDSEIEVPEVDINTNRINISRASIAGVSLSYGYTGKAYKPTMTVKVDGQTLTEGRDYTVQIKNNKDPGTATITLSGKGNYIGTRIKKFEIVDCVSSVVSGKTYQLIPKNNSKTAVCSYSGKMVNNTKVYITDRSNSEAMKFKAVKNSDGTWKFINAKCELALAVQQNSSEIGKGTVLYEQTTKKAQNWKLSKKSDNSFAIMNAVTGYSIAMSDASAVKGTTLSMAETASSGLQRFYIAETTAVSTPFDGTYGVKASKDKKFALNIASSSKADGANVNLYSYSNTNAKKFKVMYSGGGYYRLVNVNSGLCLTVKGNMKTDGANVIQSKWAGQSGQRWKIVKNSDGTVTMTNALGTVLHLTGNKAANGTNVVSKTASASKAQKWYLQ